MAEHFCYVDLKHNTEYFSQYTFIPGSSGVWYFNSSSVYQRSAAFPSHIQGNYVHLCPLDYWKKLSVLIQILKWLKPQGSKRNLPIFILFWCRKKNVGCLTDIRWINIRFFVKGKQGRNLYIESDKHKQFT